MSSETIKTNAHTTQDGMLNLSVDVGLVDVDVSVVVQVTPLTTRGEFDENGWPKDFFEHVAGSMPELRRAPPGQFEERLPVE